MNRLDNAVASEATGILSAMVDDADRARVVLSFLKDVRHGLGLGAIDDTQAVPAAVLEALRIDPESPRLRQSAAFLATTARALRAMERTSPSDANYARVGLNLSSTPIQWLDRAQQEADRTGQSQRTVIRHVDAAMLLLAGNLTAVVEATQEDQAVETVALARMKEILNRRQEVRIQSFDVTVRVWPDRVDVHEIVEIIALTEGAEYYVVGKTLPYARSKVSTDVLEGAELLNAAQPNPHWLLELLRLSKPLKVGEAHRFAVLHHTIDMAPMWTATNLHEAEELTVRVWYSDRKSRPTYLINEFPPNLLRGDDITSVVEEHAQRLNIDRSGTVSHTFHKLRRDHSYGLAWTSPGEDNMVV